MKRLIPALILMGVTCMAGQIVLVRELLILFYGNELAVGIILANWLWWTSFGSWLGSNIGKKLKEPITAIGSCEIFLAFFLVVTTILIRAVKIILPVSPGEILGFVPIWLCSFILLSGICILNGFLFVAGCNAYKAGFDDKSRLLRNDSKDLGAVSVGKVYILEAIGAGAGGIFCSLCLLRFFNSLEIIWGLSLLCLVMAAFLRRRLKPAATLLIYKRYTTKILWLGISALFIWGLSGSLHALDTETRKWQWRGYRLVSSRDSIYGNITVTRHNSHYNFYENGLLSYSIPDISQSEWTVHPALLQHPSPKNVLLIGGGISGALEEILKYPSIKSVDYTELDPLVIDMAGSILPEEELTALKDPRVNIHYIDGRRFIKSLAGKEAVYDVIVVNLPDPYTAQLNRFYTKDFFIECAGQLKPYGVIYLGVKSAENYISPALGDFLRCIYCTLKEAFPEIRVIPGESNYFIGARRKGYLTDNHKLLEGRLKARRINTLYVKDYYLAYRLSNERKEFLYKELSSKTAFFLNTDFHPICYYYGITFWSTYFNTAFKKIFNFAAGLKFWHLLAPLIFVFLLSFLPNKNKRETNVLLAITASGFSEISFQVVILLAFQVIYGYVYYKLGLILTSFMIGLALGAYTMTRIMRTIKNDYSLFIKTQAVITIYPLILPVIFLVFVKKPGLSFIGENIVFPLLPVIAGFVGGFQFPLGNKIYTSRGKEIGKAAGLTYSLDLFGSCCGALFISAFVLPILGITQTCLFTASVNLCALLVLVGGRLRGQV